MSKFTLNLNLSGAFDRLKKLVCAHPGDQLDYVRRLTVEEVNHRGGSLRLWHCRRCGADVYM